jgi:hypothetical protein
MTTDDRHETEAAQSTHAALPETDSGAESAATVRSRSPVEKIVVWSLIGGLALLAGYEAATRFGHQKSVATVDDAYRARAQQVSAFLGSDAVQSDSRARVEQGMSPDAADAAAIAAAIENNPAQGRGMSLAEAEALMTGFPRKSEEKVTPYINDVTYRWKTLLKDYGGLHIRYQIETGEILNVNDFSAGDEA